MFTLRYRMIEGDFTQGFVIYHIDQVSNRKT